MVAKGAAVKPNSKSAWYVAAVIILIIALVAAIIFVMPHQAKPKATTTSVMSTTVPPATSGNYVIQSTTTIPAAKSNSTSSKNLTTTQSSNVSNSTSINRAAINYTDGRTITFNVSRVAFISNAIAANILGANATYYNASFSTNPNTAANYFPPVAFPTLYGNISIMAGWMLNYSNTAGCAAYCRQLLSVTYLTNNSKELYKDFVLYSNTTFNTTNASAKGGKYSYAMKEISPGWWGMDMYAWKNEEMGILEVVSSNSINQSLVASSFISTMNQS